MKFRKKYFVSLLFSPLLFATTPVKAASFVPHALLAINETVNKSEFSLKQHPLEKSVDAYIHQLQHEEILQLEELRPTIIGAKTIKVPYSESFPLNQYQATTASGSPAELLLHSTFNPQQLGSQEIILETHDEATATEKYLAVNVNVVDTHAPSLTVPASFTTQEGNKIDLLKGVTAKDLEMGDLTKAVQLTHDIDFNKPGTFTLTYQVVDNANNKAEKTAKLTITPKPQPIKANDNSTNGSGSPHSSSSNNSSSSANSPSNSNTSSYAAHHLYVLGQSIPYANGGVGAGASIINNNPYGTASTYYGSSFNGNDGRFTHFIGHSPGIFSVIKSLGIGSSVVVTDGNGTPFTYHVVNVVNLTMENGGDGYVYPTTAYGQELVDNLYYGGVSGEQIVLQTCVTSGGTTTRLVYCQ